MEKLIAGTFLKPPAESCEPAVRKPETPEVQFDGVFLMKPWLARNRELLGAHILSGILRRRVDVVSSLLARLASLPTEVFSAARAVC